MYQKRVNDKNNENINVFFEHFDKTVNLRLDKNTMFAEAALKFLKHILKLSPKKLVNYLVNKIDICDLFLIKCILRKSNKNPLNTQKMICDSDKSKETMFDLYKDQKIYCFPIS